jgi:hypothetical protein
MLESPAEDARSSLICGERIGPWSLGLATLLSLRVFSRTSWDCSRINGIAAGNCQGVTLIGHPREYLPRN